MTTAIEKTTKVCNKCGELKPFEEFSKRKGSKDGYRAACKDCCKAQRAAASGGGAKPAEGTPEAASTKPTRARGASAEPPVDTSPAKTEPPKSKAETAKPAAGKKKTLLQQAASSGKTFIIDPTTIIVDHAANIRGIDEEHVEGFVTSYIQGNFVPPVLVKNTPKGAKLVAGYHRITAFLKAIDQGLESPGIECQEFKGSPEEEVTLMIRENNGKPLTPVETAGALARLRGQKWDINTIAQSIGKSRSFVEKHLILSEACGQVLDLVRDGTLAASVAIEYVRKYGDDAHTEITKQLLKQVKKGEKPGKVKAPSFPAATCKKFMHAVAPNILIDQDNTTDEQVCIFMEMDIETWKALHPMIEDYKDFLDEQEEI